MTHNSVIKTVATRMATPVLLKIFSRKDTLDYNALSRLNRGRNKTGGEIFMKQIVATAFVVFLSLSAFLYGDDRIPSLYVVGDSTAASYSESRYPLTGWAQVLQDYLDDGAVQVVNKAISGRSSKSFYDSGAWGRVRDALQEGDYVLIQFGHNDEKSHDPDRFTEPYGTYTEYLTRYINESRAAGATPVLLTSINRNMWETDEELGDTHGDYPDAVRKLAKTMDVPLIDMEKRTRALYERHGKTGVRELFLYLEPGEFPAYPDGKSDGTHLSELGAREISQAAAEGMRDLGPPFCSMAPPTATLSR
jgi:lysophospholipase L1-like esterase